MHGYGYPPEQQPKRRPSSATLVTLRVVFVALTLLSCGLLSWAAMLRLAIVTRRKRDWWLFGLVIALNVGLIAYLGSLPDEEEVMSDAQALITLTWMLVLFAGTITYYLYAEIRHFGPYGGPQAVPYGYGAPHPGAVPGYGQQTVPVQPTAAPSYGYPPAPLQQPVPAQQQPQPPQQQPAPTPPADTPRPHAPQRLDQVRAELDELSDYLRKEGDGR
ncbi:hypothetical protein [Streptomyces sp. NBC_00059]|uniref:hypothetical protein n=1 Tax=Streptomyces sp. NBC_00059 TaxID=2975635 RepID=UPI0022530F00|nr:hypothetical protein [Streptomyces sp. NBC_00059]MCX5412060.1 hypothetical protein [Streptomyces sp. NBC_00059]